MAIASGLLNTKENIMELETIMTYVGYLIAVLTAIWHFYKARQSGATAAESLLLVINTLKDESKLTDGAFSEDAFKKVEDVAETVGANTKAVEKAKEALNGRELDAKIGSYRGKPIYISDALKVGGIAQGFKNLLK